MVRRMILIAVIITCGLTAGGVVSAQGPIVNGDFSDVTGAPWVFVNQATDGGVNYTTGSAVVTGGDDNYSTDSLTFIHQTFAMAPGMGMITFDWSYATIDTAGYDACFWNLVDLDVPGSIIGGAQNLADADGMSGSVTATFMGGGNYRLWLGTSSSDNVGGPGISTFDNIVVTGGPAGQSFLRGDVNDDGGISLPDAVVLLTYLFPQGPPTTLVCDDAADANDDGSINLTDAVAVLTALFGQPPVPLPGPATCGTDPTSADVLDCTAGYTSC